jgi:hypothetical protein
LYGTLLQPTNAMAAIRPRMHMDIFMSGSDWTASTARRGIDDHSISFDAGGIGCHDTRLPSGRSCDIILMLLGTSE